jgi:hypothetical protein
MREPSSTQRWWNHDVVKVVWKGGGEGVTPDMFGAVGSHRVSGVTTGGKTRTARWGFSTAAVL